MSRAWRIEYEGALYHLLSRGSGRSDIFIGEKDLSRFLEAVGEMSQRFAIDIFAYVLKDNHYHLLVRIWRANLQKAMQWFGTIYSQRFKINNLFGLSYSGVIHSVKSAKLKLAESQ